ncbi:MAG: hypothetical protein K6G06_02795 [Butyrivibrio sp.]|nr:hypothetical protein [Butyrivibrio sp.]
MKKIIATSLICALAISAAGCGDKKIETASLTEPIPEQSEAESTSENAEPTQEETAEVTSDLYEAFKQGTASVKYRGTGDRSGYIELSSILEVDKAYTLDEIIEACKTIGVYNEDGNPNITYRSIDCGQDGVPELLVNIEFGAATNLTMIIKEINNELVMCFDQDGGERFYVEVSDNGVIEAGGASGANVHDMDYAFVDGNGDYIFYYGVTETLAPYDDYYAYKNGEDYVTIPVEGLDADHIGIRDYYFEADFTERNHMFNYYMIDDNYEDITTDADYDDSNLLKQRFNEAGINTYTKAEMDQMISDRATEIGYPEK